MTPAQQRPAELMGLDWMVFVLKVSPEAGHELEREYGVAVIVDRANNLLGVPHRLDLAAGITGLKQPEQLRLASFVEGVHRPW